MSDFSDQFPLFTRTEADIRADFDARAVAGLTPDDPDWVDTRPLSPFYLATQPSVIMHAVNYQRMNEVLAAAILETSWGSALDAIAASYNEVRNPALYATGSVTFVGTPGTLIGSGASVGVEQIDPDVDPPEFETTASGTIPAAVFPATMGVLTLPVQATEAGVAGNVAPGAITVPISNLDGVASLSNIAELDGGEEVETDDQLRRKLKSKFQGTAAGTIGWYMNEALNYPGVGNAHVIAAWNGPDSVLVIIEDPNGNSLPTSVVNGLQAQLDPIAGQGHGDAPVDHYVTVTTPAAHLISISATVTFQPGYGYDSGTGLIATRQAIINALTEYVNGIQSGDTVVYNHVLAQFFRASKGVKNVTGLTVNGATADITMATSPTAEVARINTITLS